jgi:hypothetical protein
LNIVAARGATGKNQLTLPLFLCYNDLRGKLKMSIKLILLKSGETLISDAKELVTEDQEVRGYLLKKPHKVSVDQSILLFEEETDITDNSVKVSLCSWIRLTDDDEILIRPDWVVTVVDPILNLKELYEEKVNGKSSKVPLTED